MHESFSSYLKIISFGIKQKRIIEFINLKFQKDTDRFRRKYLKDYLALEMTPENALVKLIPNDNFDFKTLGSLEEHLDEFVTKKSKEKYPSITNPYPVEFGLDRAVCSILFAICRRYKPDIVVETGVANGFSTSYFFVSYV